LVEDSEVNRMVVRTQLERGGYDVACAFNGLDAVDIFSRESFDLVLMDCQMPEMDGFDATRAMRRREAGRRTPIIALTASALVGERDKCLAAGMDDYLAKPFTGVQLREMLERHLSPKPVHPRRIFDPAALRKFPSLDARVLGEVRTLSAGDPEAGGLVAELVTLFLENTTAKLDELRAAAETGDFETVRATAHFIHGGASQIGAIRLTEMMKRIEAEFPHWNGPVPEECLNVLAGEFESLRVELQAVAG
jgi:CheY-like chemotaxis protein/HPt (histidine-containing phosphotransfer) domain-containing protein